MTNVTPTDRVRTAFRTLAASNQSANARPEAWIVVRSEAEVLHDAEIVEERLAAGESLRLAGTVIAVKNNIDVAGILTTCASSSMLRTPAQHATAVQRLVDAGAVIIGVTNMDQFATGLVGLRSPYGAVRSAHDPLKVSGGSSSGSAVVVALGIVDASLGTDTAGSGRIPAAFNGVVGLKPTLGLVPTRGVVPATSSFDTVSVFARDVLTAERFVEIIAGVDALDTTSRVWPADAPHAARPIPRLVVPDERTLSDLSPTWRLAFAAAVDHWVERGATVDVVDLRALLDAGTLLYDGALVAERTAAFGDLIANAHDADPTVAAIAARGRTISAVDYVRDRERIREAKKLALSVLANADALLLPSAPNHPSLSDLAYDPIGPNSKLGRFTNFVNLTDLCAIAIPAGSVDDGPFGITLAAPPFHDAVLTDLARRFASVAGPTSWGPPGTEVAVFGAHMSGQPLNHQLTRLGGRKIDDIVTAPEYRMRALSTIPAKPGLVRVGSDGRKIRGERWLLSPAALAGLVNDLTEPMVLGRVHLDTGSSVIGFLCEPIVADTGEDISELGGWRAYIARTH
jgi:allophanate hydrolase